MPPPYREEQRFQALWMWFILGAVSVIPFIGIFQQIFRGIPFGNNPLSDGGLIVLTLVCILPLLLFSITRLRITIDDECITVNYFPFLRKRFNWSDITEAEVIDYGFVGGWGIRMFTRHGTVYNVAGSKGLKITLDNGKKYVIGTQKPEELKEYLREEGLIDKLDLNELAPELDKLKQKKHR